MPRPPRISYEGSLQHITVRGNRGAPIFLDNADRRSFLAVLGDAGQLARWKLLSFCLMGNHAHLLLRLGAGRLSDGMHLLTTTHSHRFQAVHKTDGHIFGRRYHASVIERDEHLREAFRYVALNPWRAGLTDHQDTWQWSAHRALAGLAPAPRLLGRAAALWYFDDDPRRYREFVSEGDMPPKHRTLAELASEGESAIPRAHSVHGYSQAKIAEAFGVSQPTVSRRIRRGE
jgi:putative transposase